MKIHMHFVWRSHAQKRCGRYTKSSTEFLRKQERYEVKFEKINGVTTAKYEKEDRHLEQKLNYFTIQAVVLMMPTEARRYYRGNTAFQDEVLTQCVLVNGNMSARYPVRFVHDRTLQLAKTLRTGERVLLEQAKFKKYPGRRETEVHVKRVKKLT